MTFNPQDFVQAMAMDLAAEAPEEVRAAIFTDQRLRAALESFQAASIALLEGREGTYEDDLRAAKSRVVSACPSGAFTVERLLARAVERVSAKARELRAQGSGWGS